MMTPYELYKELNKLNTEWEIVEIFEGLRTINFCVEEDNDEDEAADE